MLYHEVYVAKEAQWPLIFLGLWLIGVPPALWLDTLRRGAETLTQGGSAQKEDGQSPDGE